MTESDLQSAVVDLARYAGWRVAHFRPARTKDGWRTPVAADGKGFPDLVLVGQGQVIFAELKSATGTLTAEQARWRDKLRACGADWRLWTPAEWDSGEIERVLTRRAA